MALQAVMWQLGCEGAGLERGSSERVGIAAHEHRDHHLSLDAQAFLERSPDAAHDALLVTADRSLGQSGDLMRELLRARQRASARHDLVDESNPVRLFHAYA